MATKTLDDRQLLNEAIATMREVRARAPQDFLVMLAILLALVLVVGVLLVIFVQEPFWKDTLLNINSEIFGALLTVILIDGLWRRLQMGSMAEFDQMARELERRKASPLTEKERQAWTLVIELYHYAMAEMRSGNIFRYVRAIYISQARMKKLEAQGNQSINEFTQKIKAQLDEQQVDPATLNHEEIVALREEIARLRALMELHFTASTPATPRPDGPAQSGTASA